uniref:Uncharacterized protein n=1 Tax=Ciona intestinalis TaxID=7719 RepID=H2XYA9_CIOIN
MTKGKHQLLNLMSHHHAYCFAYQLDLFAYDSLEHGFCSCVPCKLV